MHFCYSLSAVGQNQTIVVGFAMIFEIEDDGSFLEVKMQIYTGYV